MATPPALASWSEMPEEGKMGRGVKREGREGREGRKKKEEKRKEEIKKKKEEKKKVIDNFS